MRIDTAHQLVNECDVAELLRGVDKRIGVSHVRFDVEYGCAVEDVDLVDVAALA